MAWGLSNRLISRLVPPTKLTEPTPRTFSKRFFRVWSAQLVNSTADMALAPGAGACATTAKE